MSNRRHTAGKQSKGQRPQVSKEGEPSGSSSKDPSIEAMRSWFETDEAREAGRQTVAAIEAVAAYG